MIYASVTVYVECDGGEHDQPINDSAFGTSTEQAVRRLNRLGWWVDLETNYCLCPACNEQDDD